MAGRMAHGAVFAVAALALAVAWTPPAAAQERGTDAGWTNVVDGMRHFTGLVCPDTLATLNRTRVLVGSADRLAGCVYQNAEGISAVLRSHPSGTGEQAARSFRDRFRAAGFKLVATSGAAASGISFLTGRRGTSDRCETLWRFRNGTADYTLWISYALPDEADEIGPLVTAFAGLLASR